MSDLTIKRLQDLELFAGCKRSELRQIDQLVVTIDVPAGRTLSMEGGYGCEFFVLVDGVANLHGASSGEAALLTAGAWFGEQALVDSKPRNATVTTVTPSTLLVFGRREFNTLMSGFPTVRALLGQRPAIDPKPAGVGTPHPGPVPGALALGAVSGQ